MRSLVLGMLVATLAAPACSQILATPQLGRYGDYQFYTKGSYGAFMAPFNGAGLTFADTMVLDKGRFPNNSVISWSWPALPLCPLGIRNGICGFLNLEYGNYNDSGEQTPITPKQVKNITKLDCAANITLSGLASGYDVIYDMFLTPDAGGNQADASAEVSIFIHTPSYSQDLINGATQIGTITISGVTWQVAVSPGSVNVYYFTPSNYADVLSATLDEKAMLAYLVAQGNLTGNEYFNGLALGVEPRQGTGSANLNSFSAVLT